MTDWKEYISTMVLVKQELMRRDMDQVWPHHFPEIAASEEEISETEKELKVTLNPNYREFLQFANGWKGFYQTVDLFGTKELNHSAKMSYAFSQLHAIEKDVLKKSGNDVNQLLPIAVTESDLDLFALCLSNSPTPGKVIWFAGEVIDSFESFNEFFIAMIDYNREEIAALEE